MYHIKFIQEKYFIPKIFHIQNSKSKPLTTSSLQYHIFGGHKIQLPYPQSSPPLCTNIAFSSSTLPTYIKFLFNHRRYFFSLNIFVLVRIHKIFILRFTFFRSSKVLFINILLIFEPTYLTKTKKNYSSILKFICSKDTFVLLQSPSIFFKFCILLNYIIQIVHIIIKCNLTTKWRKKKNEIDKLLSSISEWTYHQYAARWRHSEGTKEKKKTKEEESLYDI